MQLLKRFLKRNLMLLSLITIVGMTGMHLMDTFFQFITIKVKSIDLLDNNLTLIIPILRLFGLYWFGRGLICILQQFLVGKLVSSLRIEAINYTFNNLTSLTQEYYIRNGSQTLSSYVEKYQSSICILLQSYLIYIFPPVLFMLYMMYVFFTKSVIMGSIVVIWLILSVTLYVFIHKQKHKYNDKFIANGLQTSAFINDSLNNFELNMVYQLHDKNKTIVNDQLTQNREIERTVFGWQGFNELMFTILSIGMFCSVAYFSFEKGFSSFIYYFGLSKFMFWIMWYRMEWMNMNQVHVDNVQSIETMIDLLPHKTLLQSNFVEIEGDIVLENISFKTNEGKIILSIPNLTIKKNAKVAIHGKSGCGKSTLLYLISQQIRPNSGVIKINNVDISTIDSRCFYDQIGYISQNNCFFNDTVEYNLRIGKPHATIEELKNVMNQVELDYIDLNTSINNLSAGEKQRVNIARVLFKKSNILFCDEITSSLDNKTTSNIQELIFRLFKNSTILWIDHSQCIAKKSDYILTLDAGNIVSFEELSI